MLNRRRLASLISVAALGLGLAIVAQQRLAADAKPPRVTYYPMETDQVLNNPYMGFAVNAQSEDISQPFRLAYANLFWSELEPEKGRFAFDAIEQKYRFSYWQSKGVKLIIRVVLDYPRDQAHRDIPDWLYEEIGHDGVEYSNDYGKGFSPDYSNPTLIREHEELIRQLGERYNDDPEIAFIELGSLGHWGEWHTYDGDNGKRIAFPKHAVSDQYVEPYLTYLDHKVLLMRRPHEIAKDHQMGLFNDAFGLHESTIDEYLSWYANGYTNWLTEEPEPAMPDFWTLAPSGGEFGNGTSPLSNGEIEEDIVEAKATHLSWIGPNAPYDEPMGGTKQSNIDRFLKTIGYRFVIAEESHEKAIRPGETLHVKLGVNNRGVAPFYFRWPLEVSLSDADGRIVASAASSADIRKWLPGQNETAVDLPIPPDLAQSSYTVNAAILDPDTGAPGVDLAIEGKRQDGRYALGTVLVTD